MGTAENVQIEIFRGFLEANRPDAIETFAVGVARGVLMFATDLELESLPLREFVTKHKSRAEGWEYLLVLLGIEDADYESPTQFWESLDAQDDILSANHARLQGLKYGNQETIKLYVEETEHELQNPATSAKRLEAIYIEIEKLRIREWLDNWDDYNKCGFYYLELLGAHPNCPSWILDEIIRTPNVDWTFAKIAKNPSLTQEQLQAMGDSLCRAFQPNYGRENWEVSDFLEVARNHPNVNQALIEQLQKIASL